MRFWYAVGLLVAAACGASDAVTSREGGYGGFYGGGGNGGDGYGCYTDRDCPSGLVCRQLQCVAGDGKPPEQELPRTFLRPQASPGFLWAPSPDADLVAVIDPASLRIRAVPLPPEPVQVEVLPGEDTALVLSRAGRAVSRIAREGGSFSFASLRTPRQYPAFVLSPSGRWAILYTPDGQIPDGGAEGIVGVVDVQDLSRVVELAAGRRHTNVFFRESAGQAIVVGQYEVVVIDLEHAAEGAATRVDLPEGFTDAAVREALVTEGGDRLLLRSLAASAIASLDVASLRFDAIPLPGPAHDLDVTAAGLAVAALRESGQVAWFDPAQGSPEVHLVGARLPGPACPDTPCVAAGQVDVSADGEHAVIFTSAEEAESFGWLSLQTGELAVFGDLAKPVRAVGVDPDGTTAIVLHVVQPGSTVSDDYERAVDRQEGYSVVDLARHAVQLKLTGQETPTRFLFTPGHAAVTLRSDATRSFGVDAVDLRTLVTTSVPLASAPEDAGPLSGDAAWITQAHPAGRISFVDLRTTAVRTITGFELNAHIE